MTPVFVILSDHGELIHVAATEALADSFVADLRAALKGTEQENRMLNVLEVPMITTIEEQVNQADLAAEYMIGEAL